jgi:hypothetical protein
VSDQCVRRLAHSLVHSVAQLTILQSVNLTDTCGHRSALQRLLSECSDGYRRSEQTSERFGRFESSLVGVTGTLTVLCFALLCFALLCFALRVYHADRWAPCTVRRRRSSSTAVRHGRYATAAPTRSHPQSCLCSGSGSGFCGGAVDGGSRLILSRTSTKSAQAHRQSSKATPHRHCRGVAWRGVAHRASALSAPRDCCRWFVHHCLVVCG